MPAPAYPPPSELPPHRWSGPQRTRNPCWVRPDATCWRCDVCGLEVTDAYQRAAPEPPDENWRCLGPDAYRRAGASTDA